MREYSPGDDVRFIDWNVSARMGMPFSKLLRRKRTYYDVWLISAPALYLEPYTSVKRTLITEICAVLAFAVNNNDKVGVIFFSDKIEFFIPPKKENSMYSISLGIAERAP